MFSRSPARDKLGSDGIRLRKLRPSVTLPTAHLDRETQFVRIFEPGAAHPWSAPRSRHLGPDAGGRFDHQLPKDRGATATWYAAEDFVVAVIELLHHYRSLAKIQSLHAVVGQLLRPATVIDLRALPDPEGRPALPADPDRARTQAWARSAWEQDPGAEGLLWSSRLVPSKTGNAFVLNERFFRGGKVGLRAFPGYPKRLTHPALSSSVYAGWFLWYAGGQP